MNLLHAISNRSSAAALALMIGGCTQSTSTPTEQVRVTPTTAKELARTVRESGASGAKVVLVNMWASWCVPCRKEFPDLVRIERDYRDRGLRLVFVSWDENAQMARAFLAKQGVDFPSLIKADYQSDTEFVEQFESRWTGAFPATFIYDASGKLRDFWEGAAPYGKFEKSVLKVLNGTKGEQS